jgi:hypothetical protein
MFSIVCPHDEESLCRKPVKKLINASPASLRNMHQNNKFAGFAKLYLIILGLR